LMLAILSNWWIRQSRLQPGVDRSLLTVGGSH